MTARHRTLDDDQRKMIEDYYLWMNKQVRRYWVENWPDLEPEILSAAGEGIVRAACYFDGSKSVSFARCCILQVNKYIKREIEREIRARRFMRSLLGSVVVLHGVEERRVGRPIGG